MFFVWLRSGHPWIGLICLLLSVGLGCGPEKKINTGIHSPSPEEIKAEAEKPEVPAFADSIDLTGLVEPEGSQALSDMYLPTEAEESGTIEENGILPMDSFEPTDGPEALLAAAMQACDRAGEQWHTGNMGEALAGYDEAYGLILKIEPGEDLTLLQEKEDLRYLISKRVVEIYAAQKTATSDLSTSIPIVNNQFVEREIRSFQNRERQFFLQAYRESGRYRPRIVEALRQAGLPEQLSWLPLIESGFKSHALSRARALGLWQFIPSTGYRYGLERNQWVDQRMDPEKSTQAAVRYLEELHGLFGDWMTALAAYNCGEGRVLRVINSQKLNYLDDFWDLYQRLPNETARYVPRFLATMLIINDPQHYGFELPEPEEELTFEEFTVNRAIRLTDLDAILGVAKGWHRLLNPELRYGITPDREYTLRVPMGTKDQVRSGLASLPEASLPVDATLTHVVRRGETISTIAARYRISVSRILRANGQLSNRNRIWPGQKLKIPQGSAASSQGASAPATVVSGEWQIYRVRAGDSLWSLSRQFKSTVAQIRSWNQLNSDRLSLGQELRIRLNAGESSKFHMVREGETLGTIASEYGVSLTALLSMNQLEQSSPIYPNQRLRIP